MQYKIYVHSLADIPVFLSLWEWLLKSKVLAKFQTLHLIVLSEKQRLTFVPNKAGNSNRTYTVLSADFFFFHKPNTSTPTQHWKLHAHFSPKSIFLHARVPSSQNTTTYQILLLFIRRVFSLLNRGNPSSLRISLSEKSIASNWSRVAPKFSITGIL